MSELAKMSKRGLIVSKRRFSLLADSKRPDVDFFAIDANPRPEFPVVNGNALVAGRVIFTQSLIAVVLLACAYAQILVGIIEWIAVHVIAFAWVFYRKTENVFMHPKNPLLIWSYGDVANRVEGLSAAVPFSEPLPLHKVFVAMGGDASNLSLRQLDFTVRFLKRHPQSFLSHASGLYQQPMPLLYLESCGA